MKRTVLIVDDAGNVVTIEEINLQAANYRPTDQEWFDLAWENAVDDKIVKDVDRSKFGILFARESQSKM